jgi:hypothetical protein
MLAILAAAAPAAAAELKVLEPSDRSVLKGKLRVRIMPVLEEGEKRVTPPELVVKDREDTNLMTLHGVLDEKSGEFIVPLDTTRFPDGFYQLGITMRVRNGMGEVVEAADLAMGFRNGGGRPARFTVEVEPRVFEADDSAPLTVRVFDQRGRPMPGARVTFKVERGTADRSVEITDGDGEAFISVDSDEGMPVAVTIQVENLPPVVRRIPFRG